MNAVAPLLVDRPKTLSELIEQIQVMPTLNCTQRRDLISAVNRAAELIGRSANEVTTDVPTLRQALAQLSTPRLSRKSLVNIKSGLGTALRLTRVIPRGRPKMPLTAGWATFLDGAEAKHQAWGLAGFAQFCTRRNIEPDKVTDTTLQEYRSYLEPRQLTKAPRKLCKETAWTFNAIIRHTQLNRPQLTAPASERYRAAPLDTYPATLVADLQAYKKRLSHEDLFSEDAPSKPLKPTSIRNIEAHVRQFLDAAVGAGYATDNFVSLADVVRPDVVKAGLREIVARNGGEMAIGLQNIAGTLLAIARHYVKAPVEDITSLKKIKAKTFIDPQGMCAKNAQRLDQFDDWRNQVALLQLPERLMKRAKDKATTPRAALDAMHAVAIGILLACPMRVKNLAGLDIKEHLREMTGKGQHRRYAVRVDSTQVKNGMPIDVDLGADASALLRTYLDEFRSHLSDSPGTALFPKQGAGGSRAPGNLGQDIQAAIKRETGLTVNPHLFRHLGAKLYLEANPGDYETVRRQLGHKKLDTTLSSYAKFDNKLAQERYQTAVLTVRNPRGRK